MARDLKMGSSTKKRSKNHSENVQWFLYHWMYGRDGPSLAPISVIMTLVHLGIFIYHIGCLSILLTWSLKVLISIHNRLILLILFFAFQNVWNGISYGGPEKPGEKPQIQAIQQRILSAGDDMLENLEVSYVYGGHTVGDAKSCEGCNLCLEEKQPAPKLRFKTCPKCSHCSLDCSHFVQLVFARAGIGFPYLTSTQMLDLSDEGLLKKYRLLNVGRDAQAVRQGDLLVYRGHVVIAERVHGVDSIDIIHATGGKDIREPGQGIQRERFVKVSTFRGELLKILRHSSLELGTVQSKTDASPPKSGRFKLRKVEKRNPS